MTGCAVIEKQKSGREQCHADNKRRKFPLAPLRDNVVRQNIFPPLPSLRRHLERPRDENLNDKAKCDDKHEDLHYPARRFEGRQQNRRRLDAHALGTLLRGNLVARAHVPRRQTRSRKNLLRQRLYWARLRTMLRNRMHVLLDRQRGLELPRCSDIFGVRGLGFLRRLQLPDPDATWLVEQL